MDYLCGEIDGLLTPQKSKFLESFALESFYSKLSRIRVTGFYLRILMFYSLIKLIKTHFD